MSWKKNAYLGKIFPKKIGNVSAFPTFRKGIAGGIRLLRRSSDKVPKKMQPMAKRTIREVFTKPDVGAFYFASQAVPGLPSSLMTGGYIAVKSRLLPSARKLTK